MRSHEEIPGNPWPHDMVIRIDTPHHLAGLLFVRHAWNLARNTEVPELDPVPAIGTSALPASASPAEWSARWERAWRRAWDWYDIEEMHHRLPTQDLLRSLSRPGQELSPSVPPMWGVEHGDEGIDREALSRWERSLDDDHSLPFAEHPERRNLEALIPAWQAGLESIIVLPYHGYFARRVTQRHLAVSKATRDDPALYDLALSTVY
jgi:hypothetical protein